MPSASLEEQHKCETACRQSIQAALSGDHARRLMSVGLLEASGKPRLMREKHVAYLVRGLDALGPGYVSLDAR